MMTQAFYTGISGLKSDQYAIDLVSHNLANISTVGFRGSEYEFSSLFEESLATTSFDPKNSVGIGTQVHASSNKTSQGSLQLSERSTDLAISGNGWFGVQNISGDTVYTRDGTFNFDSENNLVTLDGNHVLGTMGGNIEGNILKESLDEVLLGDIGNQQKLNFPKFLEHPPSPTQNVDFFGNLGIDDATRTIAGTAVDAQNNKNRVKLVFTKSADQPTFGTKWDVVATTESLDAETIYDTKGATATFDETGALVSHTLGSIDNNGVEVNINIGSGYEGVISIGNTEISGSSRADGTIGGSLVGYEINKNAEVIATFTNGEQSSVGKIALYHFQNEQGLDRLDTSKFLKSSNSGEAFFYKDANGQNILGADIFNYKLEGSNIDMTYGLTELIILQRSFDANSKSVTTADQLLQKALSMDA